MDEDQQTSLPTFAVSADDIGGEAAFQVYREATRDVFVSSLPSGASSSAYRMEMTAWHLGTMMMGSIRSSALEFHRSRDIVAASGLNHVMVQLYKSGGFVGHADAYPIAVEAGDICIFDMSRTLRTVATDFHNLTLMIPRPFFEAAMDDVQSLHGIVLPHAKPLAGLLASYMVALEERMPALRAREAEAAARGTVALLTTVLAACRRPVSDTHVREIASPFREIASHIDHHIHDAQLEPESIASAFGLSRATLYRIFEPIGGVADFIRRRRLTGAALDLASPELRRKKVSEIGYRWGFASEASFSRAFKSHFGINPKMARDRADRIWCAHNRRAPGHSPEREFAAWLKTLRT